jgi:hypothetical protein
VRAKTLISAYFLMLPARFVAVQADGSGAELCLEGDDPQPANIFRALSPR